MIVEGGALRPKDRNYNKHGKKKRGATRNFWKWNCSGSYGSGSDKRERIGLYE